MKKLHAACASIHFSLTLLSFFAVLLSSLAPSAFFTTPRKNAYFANSYCIIYSFNDCNSTKMKETHSMRFASLDTYPHTHKHTDTAIYGKRSTYLARTRKSDVPIGPRIGCGRDRGRSCRGPLHCSQPPPLWRELGGAVGGRQGEPPIVPPIGRENIQSHKSSSKRVSSYFSASKWLPCLSLSQLWSSC